ncbi:Acetyltransferase (GNAT) family protein [Natronoarchaeum philippinense]|uniref:Acetyltransferase (GNAT) family protein n=1 Tax=Natronoarchaeum philippinense TaxID=558529 RepID=A0A285P397_NATPI|nr:GNAT family N-acetyltransferase [Natronoarchaeum philippinense]SNZ15918.1 Acetyltransferase (GNAT) family protein [Natronoarchaeum philippinense]
MVRRYEHPDDADALWELKRAFERELGASTGGDDKAAAYEAKLDGEYRQRYREWVGDCVANDAGCIHVAEGDGDAAASAAAGDALAGYVFVLPEELTMIWDAAVLNEIYVREPYRGTGVADDLLDAAVETAERQDLPLDRLVLDVDPGNERARAFYRRHGFETWGELVARSL